MFSLPFAGAGTGHFPPSPQYSQVQCWQLITIVLKVTEFNTGQNAWESCSGLSQCLRDCKVGLKISLELGGFLARNHNVEDTFDDMSPSREAGMGQGSVLGCGGSAWTHVSRILSKQYPCFGDLIFPGEAVLFATSPHEAQMQMFAAMGGTASSARCLGASGGMRELRQLRLA